MAPATVSMVLWSSTTIVFAFTFMKVARNYGDLPEEIPIHFGITGKPDNWGGRILIWLLPVTMVLMAGFMLALVPGMGRDQPEFQWFPAAMALYIGVISLAITGRMIEVAMGRAKTLGWQTFTIIFVPILLLVIYALYMESRM